MAENFGFGVAVLSIVSGILTAISAFPLLYVPAGGIRDENFMPVSGQAILFFVLLFVVVGLIVVSVGVMFLAVPKWGMVWAVIVLALSVNNLRTSFLGSTGVLVIAPVMGLSAGLLGILFRPLVMSRIKQSSLWWRNWLTAFPFALLVIGLWEFTGIFIGCGPPEGIGTTGCELLGSTFYAASTVAIAAVLSVLAASVLVALRRLGARREAREATKPGQS